jgi:hypothetical protein
MATVCLERLTAADPAAATALAQTKVPFGAGRAALAPRVAICMLPFARTAALLDNAAASECIASALRLLINLTHDAPCGGAVAALGGVEAIATVLLRTFTVASAAPGAPLG